MIPRSILDLCPIVDGGSAAQALRNSVDLALHAERWNYHRYWLAEHHNMPGIASAATSIVIAYVAGATQRIRVGSGGVMLPNHAPLVIAEQFGTLEAMFPGRIDLGLGRAPGSDGTTARALRRHMMKSVDTFPQDVIELQEYFAAPAPDRAVRAVPGAGLDVPIWLLGSSLYSASLAAMLGLPFAFASHFAPAQLQAALRLYRGQFKPSQSLAKPHVMVAANVYAADTDGEARRLMTSAQQQFLNLRRGHPTTLQPPVDDIAPLATPEEILLVNETLKYSLVGSRETIAAQLTALVEQTTPDELIFGSHIYDHAARLHSFDLLAQVYDELLASA
jgi:luciferase family oxidoreductase group 1